MLGAVGCGPSLQQVEHIIQLFPFRKNDEVLAVSSYCSCFSTCFDKSRSIRSTIAFLSQIQLSSIYLIMSTERMVNGKIVFISPKFEDSILPSLRIHLTGNDRKLFQVSSARFLQKSVKNMLSFSRYTFDMRLSFDEEPMIF